MNVVSTILVLLAPLALIYGWVCVFTPRGGGPVGWRGRATLWVTMLKMPGAEWGNGAGVAHQIAWEYARARAAFYALLAALVVCLIGQPRLILPIAVACVGAGMFWLFTTVP